MKVTGSPETIAKRREVEQAWVDFYKAYTDAAAVPDPALADWRSRMTATGYKNLKNNIAALEKDDQHQVGPVTIDPVVLVVQARTAVVLDCIDGSRLKIVSRSGKTVQKGPKGLVPFNVRLVREGSAWLVDSIGGEDPNGRCSR